MQFKLKPLSEQVVVVTGASSGIGLATARVCAERGARVVMAARNADALERAATEIRDRGGDATTVTVDVSKREDLERLSGETIQRHGGFDTWVNNAGQTIYGQMAQVSEADHRRLFDINFWGLVNGSLIAAEHLRDRGGAIVNLGSVASDVAFPMQGMYSASKHAIKGFTDALRIELEADGAPVSLSLIKPASINTPLPEHARNYMDRAPKLPQPIYSPMDVAEAIAFAAEHGGRDYYIGGAAKLLSQTTKVAPGAVDWLAAKIGSGAQQKRRPADGHEGALYKSNSDGKVNGKSFFVLRSAYTKASMKPLTASALIAGAGVAARVLMSRRR